MINAIQTLATGKLLGEKVVKQARREVAPGAYLVDYWVHITGGMEVGDDYIRRVPQKAQPWLLLAVALSRLNGVTVESIVREAMSADPELVADIKTRADAAVASIKGMTETVCSGRIKTDLKAEVIANPMVIPKAA